MEPMILTLLPDSPGEEALVWEVMPPFAGVTLPVRVRRRIETPDGPHVEEWERIEITAQRCADYRLARIVGDD
ncbi:hypothetical protein [Leifsonia xyli]|uniref:hypothetical protein n=1 Tax=Leifsonia xyli TaxID=1575 RepID=UPI003D674290